MKRIICALLFLAAITVHGQLVFNYVKVVDTTMTPPGDTGYFTSFGFPANNGANITFQSQKTFVPYYGIHQSSNGVLTRVANFNATVSNVPIHLSYVGQPSARGKGVVFYGQAFSNPVFNSVGILRGNSNSLEIIADANTAIPSGTGKFQSFDQTVSASQSNVFFIGRDGTGSQAGAYLYDGVSLTRVVDLNTPIPSGTGNFTNWSGPYVDGTNLALIGLGNNQEGIYFGNTNGLARVADTSTPIPSGAGTFVGFGVPSVSGTNVAFLGIGTNNQFGIYVGNASGLKCLVDTNTLIPDVPGAKFRAFGGVALADPSTPGFPLSFDGQNIVFEGTGTNPTNAVAFFLYTGADGALQRVVDCSMSLGGNKILDLNLDREALSGNSIAFSADYNLSSVRAIWKAVFTTPLSLELLSPGSHRVLWPTNDPTVQLQFSTDMISWATAPPPVVLDTNNVVTNAAAGDRGFYRLFKP
jgi:hypothetical protein